MFGSASRWFSILLLSFSTTISSAQSFRFAWLSDTHVGSTTGAEDLRISVEDINSQTGIAFTIITGDITEMGSDAEFALTKSILDSLKTPYHILPGNHDMKWSESGCTMFSNIWGSDRFVFRHDGVLFIGLHEGPIMRMGDGHFAPEDLRWLDSLVGSPLMKSQPVVFATHYPLDASIDNWYEVHDRLRLLDTRVVLCGHGHANRILDFDGLPGVMGRSNLRGRSFSCGYTVVSIRKDSLVVRERTHQLPALRAWGALSFAPRHPHGPVATLSRSDSAINARYRNVAVRWRFQTGYTITAAPVVFGNRVIVCDRSGAVVCLSTETGSIQWRRYVSGAVLSTPDVCGDIAVLASVDGSVYAVDAGSGAMVWRHPTARPIVGAPKIADGLVLIGGSDSTFRAIDLKSGTLNWEFVGVKAFVETRSLVYGGKVIFGAWDTYLYSLSLNDGTLAWKWSSGNAGRLFSPAACWPVGTNGKVFIVAPDRTMTAIDATNGKTIWRSNEHQVRESIGISTDGSRVYARCMTDTVFALLSAAPVPSLLWQTACGYGYDIDPSMLVENEGIVYFGTKNGLLFAVDAVSGSLRWVHKVGVTIVNTPAPAGRHTVVVTDFDGRVTMLEEQ